MGAVVPEEAGEAALVEGVLAAGVPSWLAALTRPANLNASHHPVRASLAAGRKSIGGYESPLFGMFTLLAGE